MLRRSLLRALDRKGHRSVMRNARSLRGFPGSARMNIPAATVVAAGEPIYSGEEEVDIPYEAPVARQPVMTRDRNGNGSHSNHGLSSAARASANKAFEIEEEEGKAEDEHHGSSKAEARAALDGNHDEAAAEEEEVEDGSALAASHLAAVPPSSGAQKSTEAYRFLLDHIDAEIAALQRRHSAVTTRRQTLEERNAHRIKELFEYMESPWLLLTVAAQPPLPATGVDVYIKEQRAIKAAAAGGGGGSGAASASASASDPNDKMFILACHKNFRGLPYLERRSHDQAANFNAAVRQELKHRLATGCSRFEAFCQQVTECTPDMARAGQVPEVPATWSGGVGANRYQGISQWQRHARYAAGAATAGQAPAEGKKAAPPAGRKMKAAAKMVEKVGKVVTAVPPGGEELGSRKGRGKSGLKGPAPKKAKPGKAGEKKAAEAPENDTGYPNSIPLPDLDRLAMNKLKKMAAPTIKKAIKKASKIAAKPKAKVKPKAKAKVKSKSKPKPKGKGKK